MPSTRDQFRVAAVTGAGSGLGRALCERLARQGWTVAASDIDTESLAVTVDRLTTAGGEARAFEVDTRQADQVERYAEEVFTTWGRCDLLVNNAGVGGGGRVGEAPLEEWERVISINLFGPIHGCHCFVPRMRRQGFGHVVNIASIAAYANTSYLGPYNVAKAGVVSLSETLRAELRGTGIGVTVVCPGFFRTNIARNAPVQEGGEAMHELAVKLVDKAKVSADEIAAEVLRAVEKRQAYLVTRTDAKVAWLARRLAPLQSDRLFGWVDDAIARKATRAEG